MKQDMNLEETEIIMKKESQKQRNQRIAYQQSMGMRGMEYDRFKSSEEEEKLEKLRGGQ